MKRLTIAAAFALLLTTPAPAADYAATAEWIDTLIFYDKGCEPLGPGFDAAAMEALAPIPREVQQAATAKVKAFYISVGPRSFCEQTKEKIQANHQWLFEVQPK